MEYRVLGRTGLRVSAIGLGTEYLIDRPREHVVSVIHEALARGVNYFDLFFAQPEFRDNMGAAFAGHRERVFLTAHLGAVQKDGQSARSRSLKQCALFFEDYLTRYRTDYVDVLMLHNSDGQSDYDRLMAPGGLLDLAGRYQREGRARFIGFSGHTVSTARQAVLSGAIDVLMFPINLAGHGVEGERELLETCAARNIGLVAMKPYAGGRLLMQGKKLKLLHWHTGGAAIELTRSQPVTPVRCLSYVLSQPGVSTTVPGCKDLEELAAAQAYWEASFEERDFSALLADLQPHVRSECVYCNHCLPCPAHIDIGQSLRLLDIASNGGQSDVQAAYHALEANAEDCIACGACEERCPFGVPVIARMRAAAALFGGI
ncbi:MAG: aldo/keto reductase [Anaerolineae bacterium]|nr:aldo/keto reductase [Anaerolineae bacterium]